LFEIVGSNKCHTGVQFLTAAGSSILLFMLTVGVGIAVLFFFFTQMKETGEFGQGSDDAVDRRIKES
jgi:hypothetical protein